MNGLHGGISTRVKEEMRRQGLNIRELGKLSGIDHGNLSKLLNGKRPWQLGHVEVIARALVIPLSDLIADAIEIPIRGALNINGFPYNSLSKNFSYGTVAMPKPHGMGGKTKLLAKTYAIMVDRDDLHPFRRGTVLVAQQDSYDTIADGDLVFYCKEDGMCDLRRINFHNSHIELTSLVTGEPSTNIHKRHLSLCDKVIMAKLF